jgi:DUF1680 family protein
MSANQVLERRCVHIFLLALPMLVGGVAQATGNAGSSLTAVPFTDVVIADEFWAPRIETNRRVTIPYAFKMCEETGRISNFEKAAGLIEGQFEGIYFNDSDVYKIIEGAAYSLKLHPDPELENYVDGVIDKIAAAQWEDGYLYTFYSVPSRQPEKRWTDTKKMHELYCAGHFFEAAVAYYQATGKQKILDVATRLADHICSIFGPDKKRGVPGHQEIEIGLVKLYRQTGDEKYLKLAKSFLDERGKTDGHQLYGEYAQDHKPITEQNEAVGHAVRATYMYCGMADVAMLTGDQGYARAIDRIWKNVVGKKLYLTGGIGARRKGEAFGDDYELPNATAYNETCAAIANAMWNHRMFLLHGDARYIDILERVLYNGFLSGISLSGDKFFYPNPLESNGKYKFNNGAASRQPWFRCSCCPSNIVRFVPSIGGYAYATGDNAVYVNLFIAGSATVKLAGNTVTLRQNTGYPWDGSIKITVEPEVSSRFTIYIRVPGWRVNHPVPTDLYRVVNLHLAILAFKVNGKLLSPSYEKGFASIEREWQNGDVIELDLPMPVRRMLCTGKVKGNQGKLALERGPVVYCAEWADNGGKVNHVVVRDQDALKAEHRTELLGGITVIRGDVLGVKLSEDGRSRIEDKCDFTAIPYYAWAHRGEGEMAVWLARRPKTAIEAQKKLRQTAKD